MILVHVESVQKMIKCMINMILFCVSPFSGDVLLCGRYSKTQSRFRRLWLLGKRTARTDSSNTCVTYSASYTALIYYGIHHHIRAGKIIII